ncbi:hypothetical protein [Serratia marcescens]|uniref:hypothetical protein n=1 Tax=Serratia marcescens TaxID=615 RepID=UPI0032048E3C
MSELSKPVAELVYSSAMPRFIGDTNEVEGYRCWIHGETRLVPTMEQAYADAKAVCAAPPAPAVPDELLDAMEEVIRISDRDHEAWDKAKAAITTCRAAMLAQPVSQRYKLVPVEPTENMIIDGFESDAFMALADAVNEKNSWPYGCKESAECVKGIFKAMLAAAPTQGKENE